MSLEFLIQTSHITRKIQYKPQDNQTLLLHYLLLQSSVLQQMTADDHLPCHCLHAMDDPWLLYGQQKWSYVRVSGCQLWRMLIFVLFRKQISSFIVIRYLLCTYSTFCVI